MMTLTKKKINVLFWQFWAFEIPCSLYLCAVGFEQRDQEKVFHPSSFLVRLEEKRKKVFEGMKRQIVDRISVRRFTCFRKTVRSSIKNLGGRISREDIHFRVGEALFDPKIFDIFPLGVFMLSVQSFCSIAASNVSFQRRILL